MADTEVFTKPGEGGKMTADFENEEEAIDYAIGMEKDSLLFYYEFEKIILEKDRPVLEGLIAQEKDHLAKLIELKSSLRHGS